MAINYKYFILNFFNNFMRKQTYKLKVLNSKIKSKTTSKKYTSNGKKISLNRRKQSSKKSFKKIGGMPVLYNDIGIQVTPFNPIPIVPFNYTETQQSKLSNCLIDKSKSVAIRRPSILDKAPDATISILNPPNGICQKSLFPGSPIITDNQSSKLSHDEYQDLVSYYNQSRERYRGYYPFPVNKSCENSSFYEKYFDSYSDTKDDLKFLTNGQKQLTHNDWANYDGIKEIKEINRIGKCKNNKGKDRSKLILNFQKDQKTLMLPSGICMSVDEFNNMPEPKYDLGDYKQINLKPEIINPPKDKQPPPTEGYNR